MPEGAIEIYVEILITYHANCFEVQFTHDIRHPYFLPQSPQTSDMATASSTFISRSF